MAHDADDRAKGFQRDIGYVLFVDGDLALGDFIESGKQVDERGLTGSGRSHESDHLSGLGHELNLVQCLSIFGIPKGHVGVLN